MLINITRTQAMHHIVNYGDKIAYETNDPKAVLKYEENKLYSLGEVFGYLYHIEHRPNYFKPYRITFVLPYDLELVPRKVQVRI